MHVEVRGTGHPVLIVQGVSAPDLFEETAGALADEFTVVTCELAGDVRGRADAAATLIARLGLGPVAAYGHNGAALGVLELLLRHPSHVVGAVLHEPPLAAVLDDPAAALADLDLALRAAGGGAGAVSSAFVRAQDPALWSPGLRHLRERLLAGAGRATVADAEIFAGYRPDADLLSCCTVPLLLVEGRGTTAPHRQAVGWLAQRTGAAIAEVPGGHWSFLGMTDRFLAAIRPFLRRVSETPAASGAQP